MRERIIKILLSEEAKEFILLQPAKAQEKITYNLRKLQSGIMDKDLFKKLEGSEIWELRTLLMVYATDCLLFGILLKRHWL